MERTQPPLEPTEIVYTIEPDDVRTYYADFAAYYRRSAQARRFRPEHVGFYLSLAGMPLVCIYGVGLVWPNFDGTMGVGFLVAVLWPWVASAYQAWRFRRSAETMEGFLGAHRAGIGPEGLADRNGQCAWVLFWPGVRDIVRTRHHILFLTGRPGSGGCTPIPLRAFDTPEAARTFFEHAVAFWKDAVATTAPPGKKR